MRLDEDDASLLQEKLNVALVDALRLAYGARYSSVPLDTRARALRAGATYLRAIGVTEDYTARYRGAGEAAAPHHRRHARRGLKPSSPVRRSFQCPTDTV